jgi:hypothetical protein
MAGKKREEDVTGLKYFDLEFCKSEISAIFVYDRPSRTSWVLRGCSVYKHLNKVILQNSSSTSACRC